nr:hypothetical protein GCM10020093_023610 [Planobispora longispora]
MPPVLPPRLAVTPGKAARTGVNLRGTPTTPLTGPFMDWAIRDTLPTWAARMVMHQPLNPVERRARRTVLRLALNGVHTLTGPLEEFRQAQARVAGGITGAPPHPPTNPGATRSAAAARPRPWPEPGRSPRPPAGGAAPREAAPREAATRKTRTGRRRTAGRLDRWKHASSRIS